MKKEHRGQASVVEGIGLVQRLAAFGPAYTRWIGRNLPTDGISAPRLRLLAALHEQGSMSIRALTQTLNVSAQNVSVMVDGLEAQRLVQRRDDPDDRRVVLVELTKQGRIVVSDGMDTHQAAAASLFSVLSPSERAVFAVILDKLIEELRSRGT
ncbi:MarR family winged helix-turn-helix transcriptional regulator [Pseudoxanthomonas sp.]|uniref:MarR family winged helix-turn-helix transcriptional regulator n=1 Tax=Pseudoxanthomonas sp. TaxID=1871049 RepID=UPI002E11907B|nr:MarR family transcriptional regulator [Pseudoxanthomonas sp.]